MAKLLIDIDVNGQAKVKQLDKAFKDVEHSAGGVSKQSRATAASIATMATGFVSGAAAVYALQRAFRETLSAGFEFAKQMEESKAGLQSLALAVQDKNIPLTERMTAATKEATVVMAELQKVNAKTPHTLDQTNQIYKAMYVSMKNVGASSQDIIGITQKLSVAAGAAGIEFNSLLAGVDGLATGTVLANSDLGRFLSSLGLTNEELKSSTDVVKLLNESLQDFKAIDTITTATSNLKNAWGALAETVTRDIFTGAKDGMNELSGIMGKMSEEDTQRLREALNGFAVAATTAVLGVAKAVVFLADGFEALGARIAGAAFRIEHGLFLNDAESAALERMYQGTKDNIAARGDFIKSLELSVDTMSNSIKANEKKKKAIIDESEAYDILNEKVDNNTESLGQSTDAELDKIYADELLALGLDEQGNELDRVNDRLGENADAYDKASAAVRVYEDSINSLSVTQSASERNSGTSGVYKTTSGAYDPGTDYVNTLNPYTYTSLTTDALGNSINQFGYADGGYTGDIPTNQVAGVVHGKEYVVNAKTTKDLGLNNQGGVFGDMRDLMYELTLTMKQNLKYTKRTAISGGI